MPLDGTNKLCEKCTKSCKQFQQVIIFKCPNYVCQLLKPANSTQEPYILQGKHERTGIKKALVLKGVFYT